MRMYDICIDSWHALACKAKAARTLVVALMERPLVAELKRDEVGGLSLECRPSFLSGREQAVTRPAISRAI